jgi:hypothetical protein
MSAALPPDIVKLQEFLQAFDPRELASGLGGLQLLPKNANRLLRLEVGAAVIAAIRKWPSSPKKMKRRHWQRFLDGPPIGGEELVMAEDPFNNVFSEAFTFFGGSYHVLSGPTYETTYVLRRLAEALFILPNREFSEEFIRSSYQLFHAVLILNDYLCKQAKLERGEVPPLRPSERVILPSKSEFALISESVTFSESCLHNLLAQFNLPPNSLGNLVGELGDATLDEWRPLSGPMLRHPILKVKDDYIVVLPCSLLSYLRHEIICRARSEKLIAGLVDNFREATIRAVTQSLAFIGNTPVQLPADISTGADMDEAYFSLDRDKLIGAEWIVDDLRDYEEENPFGTWDTSGLSDRIERRIGESHSKIVSERELASDVLHLILVQGFERSFMLGIGRRDKPHSHTSLVLSGSDLETIALLEGGQQLALYQFAKASDQIRDRAWLHTWSVLDEYSMYRSHHHSYYLTDQGLPDFINVSPFGAGPLREEVNSKFDIHGVHTFGREGVLDVALLFGDRKAPIYAPFRIPPGDEVQYYVELDEVGIWITAPTSGDQPKHRELAFLFVDAIAYWIWQFSPSLREQLAVIGDHVNPIMIEVHPQESDDWWEETIEHQEGQAVKVSVVDIGRVRVDLFPELKARISGPDNSGERELITAIVPGLLELIPHLALPDRLQPKHPDIEGLLEKHAPLGKKKKVMFLSGIRNPELFDLGLPPLRKVQDFDEQVILDQLGGFLIDDLGLETGLIAENRRLHVLNSVVEWLFKNLTVILDGYSSEGLVEALVARNERFVFENAHKRLTFPTRVECFSSIPEIAVEIAQELPSLSKASVANRFLIEYIATCPPAGRQLLSLSSYDRALSLSALIIHFANISDLINYDLSDVELVLLPSLRLGVRMDKFQEAQELHLSAYSTGQVHGSYQRFHAYWPSEGSSSEGPGFEIQDLDVASTAEFGLSFTQMGEFLSACTDIAIREAGGRICVLPTHQFKSEMAELLSWPIEKIDQTIDVFALRNRENFLNPPEPYDQTDVYPWRHNRALSFIRKPLVKLTQNGNGAVVWGPRQVHMSGIYLLNLIQDGRLKATTSEMKQLMSAIKHSLSEGFNQEIYEFFKGLGGVIVRQKVKKVGRYRIERRPGEAIGDIDVLAADVGSRILFSVEAKSLKMASTPRDIAGEMATLFGGEGKPVSTVGIHRERQKWIVQHKKEILVWMGLDSEVHKKWGVVSYIVVDTDLISPYVAKSSIPVITFRALKERILVH